MRYSTIQTRRSANAAFAQEMEAALAALHARLHLAGGRRGPEAEPGPLAAAGARAGEQGSKGKKVDPGRRREDGLRTRGHEPVVVRTKSGRLQVRLAHKGKLTRSCEQVFLAALAATCNVRLSAAAAGASVAAFYRRRRQKPAFAREMRLAMEMGYERIQLAAMAAAVPESHADDCWRHCDEAPMPPMSANQMLQLLYLHQKSVRMGWEMPHRRRRRGESDEVYCARLAAMWRAEKGLEAERDSLRRAARFQRWGDWHHPGERPLPLPPLELVTGWSRVDPAKKAHDPELALFGGWRIAEMKRKMGGG